MLPAAHANTCGAAYEYAGNYQNIFGPFVSTPEARYSPGTDRIYPNPAGDHVNIEFAAGSGRIHSISIYNSLGALIFSQTTPDGYCRVDLSGEPEGFYLVRIDEKGYRVIRADPLRH